MNSHRTAILLLCTLLMTAILLVDSVHAQTAHAPTAGVNAAAPDKKAEEQFKNIQVLKGVPADQIFPTMQFITASLGVECDFCHVQGAFDKDDKKPKATARKMMQMMFAINRDNFDGHREVTCYSCHRGNKDPVGIPAVMAEETTLSPRKEELAKDNPVPSPDQLFDKYIQAAGGAAAIDKISSRVMKGTIDFGGHSLPIDIYAKDPGMRISYTHMSDGDNVTAFNGREGWLGTPGRPLREMHGSDLDGASIDADLHLATHLRQMFTEVQPRGTERIGDHETYVVAGTREGKPPIICYFDQKSGLLLRLVRFGETALGRMPTQIDYADYREKDGVKIPYRWTLARPSGRFTIQLSDLQQNVPVDDSKFLKPVSSEPPKSLAK